MNGIEVPFAGNLTRDPEIRFTTGGRAVASCGVAVSRRYQQNGEWQEQTTFLDLVIWGTLGENVASCLTKGTRVVGAGRLEQRSWENEAGEKRSKFEVIVDSIGPDLRWATVTVEKVARTDSGDQGGSSGGPQRAAGQPEWAGDEEPF